MTLAPIHSKVNSYQNFATEYGNLNLTNHLPMAQFALYRVGASDADFDRFTNYYIDLHGLRSAETATGIPLQENNWRNYLGERKFYSDFRLFFARQLTKLGRTQFLKLYFNDLAKGISSAAFHSLIRLAYGVDSDNDEEILSGMAYLADAYLELHGPIPPLSESGNSLHNQMNYVSEELSSGRLVLPDLEGIIFEKMDIVSQPEVLASISENIAIPVGTTLRNFADLALNLYLSTKDFTTLHTVTSCHASRIMMQYVEHENLYLQYYYQAFLAAYLTIGAPPVASHETTLRSEDDKLIEEIKSAAQKATDDHDIKLTYTALEEHQAYNNNLYLRAAAELYPDLQLEDWLE
ncbi:MAG: questin oxidase family protein [Cyanobacteria bacterium SZAS-4]|nr:questin oxidase family protein [Cyanobacteria bacterium SZAS-4]